MLISSMPVKVWLFSCLMGLSLASPASASDRMAILKNAVVLRNKADMEKSLREGSYRGEAGILRLRPEAAESFGMAVYIDTDYLEARDGFAVAESFLDRARAAMASKDVEPREGTHARRIAENYLEYRRSLAEAKRKMALYRARLAGQIDDRLKDDVNERVLDSLLSGGLGKAESRLRDGLGYFYNAAQGAAENAAALTPENVEFVNAVFNDFTRESPKQNLRVFGLDRIEDFREQTDLPWTHAVPAAFQYTSFIEESSTKLLSRGCDSDPLLFLALIRRESNFDTFAVSSAGAAGLTQMMPATALELGVKNVYNPGYLAEAGSLYDEERKARARATAALHRIIEGKPIESAAEARDWMQRAMDLAQQREKLWGRYRKELLESRADDRLNPAVSIEFGYRYFCDLMREYGGDLSLALAAYNAGSSRVKEFGGIPPFPETVRFRNRVLEYYREYLKRLRTGNAR